HATLHRSCELSPCIQATRCTASRTCKCTPLSDEHCRPLNDRPAPREWVGSAARGAAEGKRSQIHEPVPHPPDVDDEGAAQLAPQAARMGVQGARAGRARAEAPDV